MTFPADYVAGDLLPAEDMNKLKNSANLLTIEAGENLALDDVVYIGIDELAYKVAIDITDHNNLPYETAVGVVITAATTGNTVVIQTDGVVTLDSALTTSKTVSERLDQFAYGEANSQKLDASNELISQVILTGENVANISKAVLKLSNSGSPIGSLVCSIRELTTSQNGTTIYGYRETGADLVTSDALDVSTLSGSWTEEDFVFSTPYTLEPNKLYALVVYYSATTTIDGGNYINVRYSSNGANEDKYVPIGGDNIQYGRMMLTPDGGIYTQTYSLYFETHYTEHVNVPGAPVFFDENGDLSLVPYTSKGAYNYGRIYGNRIGEVITNTKIRLIRRPNIYLGNLAGDSGYFNVQTTEVTIPLGTAGKLRLAIGAARRVRLSIAYYTGSYRNTTNIIQLTIDKDIRTRYEMKGVQDASGGSGTFHIDIEDANGLENMSIVSLYYSGDSPTAKALGDAEGFR